MKSETCPLARIFVCVAEKPPEKAACLPGEGEKCVVYLKEEIIKRNLKDKVWVTRTRCQNYCIKDGTSILFEPTHEAYSSVRFEEISVLLDQFLAKLHLES